MNYTVGTAIATSVMLAGLLMPAGAEAQAAWGSVAIIEGIGAYGLATNMTNKEAAGSAALSLCQNQGARNCQVKVYFRGCAAIATDQNVTAYGIGVGSTRQKAISNAVGQCSRFANDCYAEAASCNN